MMAMTGCLDLKAIQNPKMHLRLNQEQNQTSNNTLAARMDFNNNGLPDWMEELEETRSTPALEQSEETVEGEFPTWLTADEGSDKSSKLPDWLIDSGSTNKDADPFPAAENDLPDWLDASDDQPTNRLEEGNEEITQPDRTSEHHDVEAGSELPAADDDKTVFSTGYVGQETVPNPRYKR